MIFDAWKQSWQQWWAPEATGGAHPLQAQLELPISRPKEPDRNFEKGGRSFYFFDFDDNVAFLSTPAFIFHSETGAELQLSSGEFAQHHRHIGKSGPYQNYRVDFNDQTGTFRCFRDRDLSMLERVQGRRQYFVEDLAAALGFPDLQWKGPSWDCFYHAALNQRPVSLITARGHKPDTIREGVALFVKRGFLPMDPNYLSIFPVTNLAVRRQLGDDALVKSVAELKRAAISASVERAVELYGANPHHRFGMSDDDPHNIELIVEEMTRLKSRYQEMSFFVIETQHGKYIKWEVYPDRAEPTVCADGRSVDVFEQLSLL